MQLSRFPSPNCCAKVAVSPTHDKSGETSPLPPELILLQKLPELASRDRWMADSRDSVPLSAPTVRLMCWR